MLELELIDMRLVFISEDFDQYSDEINVFEFIIVGYPSFTSDYTIWVLMILLMLIIKRRGFLNSILHEDVYSLFISVSIDFVDLEDISRLPFMIDS